VAEVPPALVTVTSTVPVPAGLVHVMLVPAVLTAKAVAAVPPKETLESLVNPVPVIVTVVAPAVGPTVGLTAVTVGAFHAPARGVPLKFAGPYTKELSATPLSLLFRSRNMEAAGSYKPIVSVVFVPPVQLPARGIQSICVPDPFVGEPYKKEISPVPVVLLVCKKNNELVGL
jgi:hypothetical protein